MKHITTEDELTQLCELLKSKSRRRVICVFTHKHHLSDVDFDWQEIDKNSWQFCDNYLVANTELTRKMAEIMPGSAVYGGAARTYPVGFWQQEERYAPLRSCPNSSTKKVQEERLESDIWYWANQAGSLSQVTEKATPCIAEVMAVFEPSLVWVKVEDKQATLRQEMTFPGIPVEWVFKKGQKLKGSLLASEKLFVLDGAKPSAEEILKHFDIGSVTVGLVSHTDRTHARVKLHPNVEFELEKSEVTGNPFDVVSKYLVVGDVVPVRIYRHPQGKVRLRMDDIDDDETVLPAIPLLEGSEPWLAENRDLYSDNIDSEERELPEVETSAVDEVISALEASLMEETSKAPLPADPRLERGQANKISLLETAQKLHFQNLKNAREEIAILKDQNRLLKVDLGNLQRKYRDNVGTNSDLRAAAKQARQVQRGNQSSTTFSRRSRFKTSEDWMREEIRRVWIGKYTPEDREKYRLDEKTFSFGKEFFNFFTAELLNEDEARKAIRAMLDLVTRRQGTDINRETHPVLLNGKPEIRNGDAKFRMWVENGTAQAKRLTYWKLKDGGYELVKVAKHDSF